MYKLKLSLALYLLVFLACSKSNVLKNTSEDNLNKIDSVQRAIDQSSIPQKTKNIVTSKYSGYRSVHTTLVNQFIYETSGLVSKWDKDYAHYKTYSYLKDVIFVQNYYNGNYYYEYHLDAQSRIENCYQNSILIHKFFYNSEGYLSKREDYSGDYLRKSFYYHYTDGNLSQVIESPQNDGTGIVTKITPSDELYDGKFINSMIFIKYPDIDYGPLTPFLGKPVKNLIYEIYNETLGFNKHTFEIIKNDQNIINKIYYASNGVILEEVNINSN